MAEGEHAITLWMVWVGVECCLGSPELMSPGIHVIIGDVFRTVWLD